MSEVWHLPLLFATGLVAGFVDSIAGGGGLITIPVLKNLVVDPKLALGTNKLQATFGSGSASWHYAAAGAVNLKDCTVAFGCSLLGAALGAHAALKLDASILNRLIPVLLAVVAVYALVRPQLGDKDLHPRMSRPWFDILFGVLIGFYDGFFGPGTGTFWAVAFVLGVGFNLTKATGYTKVMNFASNLSSLIFFLAADKVLFVSGITMGIGQLLGARVGSRMVVARGTKFIRPVFISVVLIMTGKLLYDAYLKPPTHP